MATVSCMVQFERHVCGGDDDDGLLSWPSADNMAIGTPHFAIGRAGQDGAKPLSPQNSLGPVTLPKRLIKWLHGLDIAIRDPEKMYTV